MTTQVNRESGVVRGMFDRVARRYDLLNHVLSLNLDRRWRRAAASALGEDPVDLALDLCGGTGDLSVEIARSGRASRVICADFSRGMLARADEKFRRLELDRRCLLLEADGLRLPFADGGIDAVTVAFGVRNFEDLDAGFREIHRVLRPGGRLIVLEFSTPTAPVVAPLYRWYLRHVLPRVGDTVSGRAGPYRYLATTIAGFPDPAHLAGRIRECGFAACGWTTLTGGIVAIHTGHKT